MRTRRVPWDLYDAVLKLTAAIAQPNEAEVDSASASASASAAEAQKKLVELFDSRQAAGNPDPFLTETLADLTDDDADSVRLYRLALQQCSAFPGEPTLTKRLGLIERLLELGRSGEAGEEMVQALREAFAAGDADAIKELDIFARKL